jgi:hypothetical protein
MLATELKGELARIIPARTCCRRAELAGLTFSEPVPGTVRTLDHATARLAVQLATTLAIPVMAPPAAAGRGQGQARARHHLRVRLADPTLHGWTWTDARSCDRRSFLRGALLGASVSLGASGPHVEFVLRDRHRATELRSWLASVGIRAGTHQRRGRQVVYLKALDDVAHLLQLAGASRALLDLESGRVARDVRNRLNRLLNAEEANLGRTVRAADRQLQAIRQLAATGELERLPDALRETAAQRRLQPEADLDTLASTLGISRSAANHRLRRLIALAAEGPGSEKPTRTTARRADR